jgi:prepilin peptidase CpaA
MALSLLTLVALAAYVLPLILAALSDMSSLRIPNPVVLALAGAYPLAAFALGHGGDIPWHAVAGGAVFAIGTVLYAFKALGAGDVKLLAAAALWIGPNEVLIFVALTTILGGAVALLMLLQIRLRGAVWAPIPYGVPIMLAGVAMAPTLFLPA